MAKKQQKKQVKLLKPFPLQRQIIDDPARFKVLACGRRFSKTSIGEIVITEDSLKRSEEVFWIAPTFKTSTRVWKRLKQTFKDVTTWKSESERTVELLGGGIFTVWSAQNYDAIRGSKPKTVILDEAAMMIPDVWEAVVRPSLSDKKGNALFLSTPRGRNFFHELYLRGISTEDKDSNYKSWRYPSWYNPYMPKSEFIEARRTLHEKLFGQEYMADFLLDASEVFFGVTNVCNLENFQPYDGIFCMGVDLARKNDYTVVTVWDKRKKMMVDMMRMKNVNWTKQKEAIVGFYNKWNTQGTVTKILMEENYNDSVIEDLKQRGLPTKGFRTTNKSKAKIVNNLAVGIQNRDVNLLNDKDLLFEFQAFGMNVTSLGAIQYTAPSGYHDDIVMSSCLGYEAIKGGGVTGSSIPKSIFQR